MYPGDLLPQCPDQHVPGGRRILHLAILLAVCHLEQKTCSDGPGRTRRSMRTQVPGTKIHSNTKSGPVVALQVPAGDLLVLGRLMFTPAKPGQETR